MNIASINSSPSFDLNRQPVVASQKKAAQSTSSTGEDFVSLRPSRPESRDEVRNFDDALALAAILRAGILAKREDALDAQANQDSAGLSEILG